LTDLAIEARRLSKIYRSVDALVECDLAIEKGKIFGLLGPNGAGKTTLLRTLLGFLRPTSGTAALMGFDCATQSVQVRQQVSYLPGEARFYRTMRGREVVDLFSGLQHHGSHANSLNIAKRLELDLSRRVMFMSTGMRQKLAISIVLGSDAPVVILDEPTANLDPTIRSEVVMLIREIHNGQRTILLSSHIFSDIEGTCDEVAILKQGRVVGAADLHKLRQLHIVRGRTSTDSTISSMDLKSLSFIEFSRFNGTQVELQLSGSPTQWLAWLAATGIEDMTIDNAGVRGLYERYHAPSRPQFTSFDD
jgi:ABC-2 type transport system ATP-binding protein